MIRVNGQTPAVLPDVLLALPTSCYQSRRPVVTPAVLLAVPTPCCQSRRPAIIPAVLLALPTPAGTPDPCWHSRPLLALPTPAGTPDPPAVIPDVFNRESRVVSGIQSRFMNKHKACMEPHHYILEQ